MSGSITLGLLSAAMLSAGCGGSAARPAGGRVFYDAGRSPVPRGQWLTADRRLRQPLFDANGNPVPEAEVLATYNAGTTYSSGVSRYHRSPSIWWGPSFYSPRPSYGPWTPSYRRPAPSSSAGPGRTYFGGSRPNTGSSSGSRSWFGGSSGSSKPSAGGSSSGGSVSRGGIGGGGSHAGGSSS